jgi:hypothetical protein
MGGGMNTYRVCIESWTAVTHTVTGYQFEGVERDSIPVTGYRAARAVAMAEKAKRGNFSQVILRHPDGYGFVVDGRGVRRGR